MADYSYMWDGNLGRIEEANIRIEGTKSDIRYMNVEQYIAGTDARKLEKMEI